MHSDPVYQKMNEEDASRLVAHSPISTQQPRILPTKDDWITMSICYTCTSYKLTDGTHRRDVNSTHSRKSYPRPLNVVHPVPPQ